MDAILINNANVAKVKINYTMWW